MTYYVLRTVEVIKFGRVLLRTPYRRGDKGPVVTYFVLRTVEVIKFGSVLLRTPYCRGDKVR